MTDFLIQPGQIVKILFRNGSIETGKVIKWTDEKSIIKSLNSNDLLIIQKTLEDVFVIKIINEQKLDKEPEVIDDPVYITDSTLKTKKLVELHAEKVKLEKEQTKKKLFSLDNTNRTDINYGIPTRITTKMPSALIGSREKIDRCIKKNNK